MKETLDRFRRRVRLTRETIRTGLLCWLDDIRAARDWGLLWIVKVSQMPGRLADWYREKFRR